MKLHRSEPPISRLPSVALRLFISYIHISAGLLVVACFCVMHFDIILAFIFDIFQLYNLLIK